MSFSSLPNELITKILDNVHPRDIIRSQMTCRTIRDLVQDSVYLQYRIDLFSACMVEGDRRGLSTGDCRTALRLREQAWHELRWRKKIDVELPGFASVQSFVHLVGGILFVFGDRHENFRAARYVLPSLKDSESETWIHSRSDWEEFEFEFQVERFAIDISQDLLVLVDVADGFQLHFRTLSISHVHPCAFSPILASSLYPGHTLVVAEMQVAGDHVAILAFGDGAPTVFDLWNWRTGIHQRIQYPNNDPSRARWKSFLFLDGNTILFCTVSSFTKYAALEKFVISSDSSRMDHTASFSFPRVRETLQYTAVFANRRALMRPTHRQIHSCDPNQSVIVVQLAFKIEYLEVYALVVEKATLSSTNHRFSRTSSGTPTFIPWDDWSAHGTRLIREYLPVHLPAAIHGTRYAFVADTNNGLQTLQVFDFNTRRRPVHLNRDGERGHDADTANVIRVNSDEGTIHSDGFTHPVRTSLPYHMVSTGPIFNWTQIMMDEDYIVGTQRKSGGGMRAEVLIM